MCIKIKKEIKWIIIELSDGSYKGYNLNAFKARLNEVVKNEREMRYM